VPKAREKLGWEPKIKFKELVKIMVDADMELKGLNSPGEGQRILKEKGIDWKKNQVIEPAHKLKNNSNNTKICC